MGPLGKETVFRCRKKCFPEGARGGRKQRYVSDALGEFLKAYQLDDSTLGDPLVSLVSDADAMDSDSGFIERFPSWTDIGDDEAKEGCQELCKIAVQLELDDKGMMTRSGDRKTQSRRKRRWWSGGEVHHHPRHRLIRGWG